MRMAVALGLGLVGLAGALLAGSLPAEAHGELLTMVKDNPPYHVIFYTQNFVTEGEVIPLAWNVSDLDTKQQVRIDDPEAWFRFYDAKGALAKEERKPLQQPADGILVREDVVLGPPGTGNFTLFLPGGRQVSFEQVISGFGPPAPAPARSPGPEWAVPLAMAAVAVLVRVGAGSRRAR